MSQGEVDVIGFQLNPDGDRQDISYIVKGGGGHLSSTQILNIWDPIPQDFKQAERIILSGRLLH